MEKRQFTRVGFRICSTVTINGATFEGEVDNISLRGIFIKNICNVVIGEAAGIVIKLNPSDPEVAINLEAVPVRSGADGTAFEFRKIDIDSFIHLRKVVSYATSDEDAVMEELASYVDQKVQAEEAVKE